jgi:hypothetical protein
MQHQNGCRERHVLYPEGTMFDSGPDRGPPTAMRGWLSDVYVPTLLETALRDKALDSLARRLGAKATVDDPIQGRATGLEAITAHVRKTADWLIEHAASYGRLAFTTGIDRDVTEGTLSLTFESKTVDLPIAVVAERRRSREVELRVYYATAPIDGSKRTRARLVPNNPETLAPPAVVDFLGALAKGDIAGITAAFETEGSVRDARGLRHAKKDGELRAFFDALIAGGAFGGGLELERGGSADDGRSCAVEFTLVKARGSSVTPQAGLLMFERGDSGLLRSARLYGDLEA